MISNSSRHFMEHEIEWDGEKISRLWNYYSRTSPFSGIYFSKLFGREILKYCGLRLDEPLEVLDFGCGPGFIWDHLSRLGSRWQYTGLDFSSASVGEVVRKAAGSGCFKGAYHISSLPVDLPDAHFDVVLLFEVVEHLNDIHLNGALAEVARLLKRGGVVAITTPNAEDLSKSKKFCPECGAIFHEWQHVRSWNVESLSGYMSERGFGLRMVKTLDFTAERLSVRGLLRKARGVMLSIINGAQSNPHMIAVFQKL